MEAGAADTRGRGRGTRRMDRGGKGRGQTHELKGSELLTPAVQENKTGYPLHFGGPGLRPENGPKEGS